MFSATAIADPALTEWNTYNLAFTAVLPESGDPGDALADLGVSPPEAAHLERFVGVPFGPSVTEAWDRPPLQAFRATGRSALVQTVATNPQVWPRLLHRGTATLGELQLDYLSNFTAAAPSTAPVATADRPHPADVVLTGLSSVWWVLPVSWLAVIGACVHRLRRGRTTEPGSRALVALVLFGVAFGAGQTILALADGYYELAKHLVIAGEVTALSATGLAVAGIESLRRRWSERLPEPAVHPAT